MKTLLSLMFSFLSIANLNAQEIYIPGKIAKGEKVAYYCKVFSKWHVEIRNINNTDTTSTIYYEDGTIVPDDEMYYPTVYAHSQEDLIRIFREAFTPEERQKIKGKSGGLFLSIVADSLGNTKELTFIFQNDDSVLSKFTPDRFYQLEQKFKEAIKFIWHEGFKRMRNVKYTQSIYYRELE